MKINYSDYLKEAHDLFLNNNSTKGNKTAVAKFLYKKHNVKIKFDYFRRGLSKAMNKYSPDVIVKNETKPNDYKKPFVLSAWSDKGYMMSIDQYCEHYKLPRKDITSYKLVSHTGTPFYNIVFKENVLEKEIDYSFFEEVVRKNVSRISKDSVNFIDTPYFDKLVYTDVHIGMTPNESGYALYGSDWDEKELNKRLEKTINYVLSNKKGNMLLIDELGDFLDGYNGETTRKGHDLPQNMDNQEMFDVGLSFKIRMIDELVNHYEQIVVNNICEDNHAGSFGYIVNSAFKLFIEYKYSNVKVNNHRKFINHYFIGDHCFVISHGKDSKSLKFGFKPHLDSKQIEKIDQYLKQNGIYKKAKYITFCKGDSHLLLFDLCSSDDFDYFNYLAYSPSSEWVQTNFKKGRSGFVLEHIPFKSNEKILKPYFF